MMNFVSSGQNVRIVNKRSTTRVEDTLRTTDKLNFELNESYSTLPLKQIPQDDSTTSNGARSVISSIKETYRVDRETMASCQTETNRPEEIGLSSCQQQQNISNDAEKGTFCTTGPSSTVQTKKRKGNLLHSAMIFGACPETVKSIIARHPDYPSKQDENGRTPLHLACICWQKHKFSLMAPISNGGDNEDEESRSSADLMIINEENQRVMDVVRELCDSAQLSINVEDNDGMCALEYAVMSEMPIDVVKRIQKASVEEWRMRENHPELFQEELEF